MAGLLLALVALAVSIVQRDLARQQGTSAGAAGGPKKPSVPAIRGKAAPDFALPDLDGATVRRANFQGKVLLVNFWATWCHPCLIEIPWFLEFQKQYGPQGFEVVGISLDEEKPAVVKKFVEEHDMTFTVVMGDDNTADLFGGIIGLPTTFLVDREGKFYSMHRGLVSRNSVEEELRALLGMGETNQADSPAPQPQPAKPPA